MNDIKIIQSFGNKTTGAMTICSNGKCKYFTQCVRTKKEHIRFNSVMNNFNKEQDNCFKPRRVSK